MIRCNDTLATLLGGDGITLDDALGEILRDLLDLRSAEATLFGV